MNNNIEMLKIVAKGLSGILDRFVFVGGTTTTLYVDTRVAPESRPTDDVDCLIQISSFIENQELEEALQIRGFCHDTSQHAPRCRWIYAGIKVDDVTTDERYMGFSNKWYEEGIRFCESHS